MLQRIRNACKALQPMSHVPAATNFRNHLSQIRLGRFPHSRGARLGGEEFAT